MVLMNRALGRIRSEIKQKQDSLVQDTGTRNAIFIIRILSEWAVQVYKDLYLCFLDYTNAFDRVWHKEILDKKVLFT